MIVGKQKKKCAWNHFIRQQNNTIKRARMFGHHKQQVILKFQLSSCRTTEIEFKHVETCGCEESCLKLNRSRQTTTTNDCENFVTK